MYLSCRSIPLDSINLTPDWNLHPWELTAIPPELQADLAVNGIIHPPLVIADSEETFTVVAGAKRLEFLRRSAGPASLDCMVIAKDAPPGFIVNLVLADQSYSSPLSLPEKARFIEIALQVLKMEDFVTTFQTRLRLKGGRSTIANLLKILRQDTLIIRAIHEGRIQERMVADILSLPQEADRMALVQLFLLLNMGDGKQKRFFTLIRDIASRQGSSVWAYLQKTEITAILDHEETNIPQKIQHLGDLLQHELCPASSQAEEIFTKQINSLNLPANYTVAHSPSFEKDEVTLSITFKDFFACKQYLEREQESTPR
jgi:hypothetical protein